MPTLEDEIQSARERFVAWVRWYMKRYPEKAPSRRKLADLIGVSGSAVTQLLAPGSDRAPAFETLVGFRRLTGFPMDLLLYGDPPRHDR